MAKPDPSLNPNLKPEDDPCQTGPGTGLAAHLLSHATPFTDAPPTDCEVDRGFRMRDLLPPRVIGEDEQRPDGFIAKFLDSLDDEVNAAWHRVDCFPTIIDPQRAPSKFLDLLLYNLGNPFTLEEGLADQDKRRLATALFAIYALKGTCPGIVGMIRILYGINVTECVQGNIDCWILGESILNIDTDLCPGTAFERRTFAIMVDVNLTATQRLQITNVVDWLKPANTHFAGIIEPHNPNHQDHWILDFSGLGDNTFLHQ